MKTNKNAVAGRSRSCSNLGGGNAFKIAGFRAPDDQGKYSSNSTRFANLNGFMGGAEINEVNILPGRMPHDDNENLEAKFKSGVNRTDIPRMWGHPDVIRNLGPVRMSLANDIFSWRRAKGEPLYKGRGK